MKKLYKAFVVGFRTASTSLRMVLVLCVFNLVIALPVALMFHNIMTGALGNSMVTDRLLQGFDVTVYIDFIGKGGKALNSLISQVGWLAMLTLVLNSVLDGGILGRLNSVDRRYTLASFLGDCGRYFWRYVRLTLIFAPVLFIVFLASLVFLGSIFGAIERNAVSEVSVFWTQIIILGATFFLVGLVVLISDYARVETARSDARSMVRASWSAVRFVFRRFFTVVGLELGFLVVSVCVIAAYLLAESPMYAATWGGMLLLVVLQQLTIFLRMLIRVATFAGERHLYVSTVPDLSDSFPLGLASSLPAYPAAHPLPPARPAPSAPPVPAHPAPAALPVPAAPPAHTALPGPVVNQVRAIPDKPRIKRDVVPVRRARRKPRAQPETRPRTRAKGKVVKRPATRRRVGKR